MPKFCWEWEGDINREWSNTWLEGEFEGDEYLEPGDVGALEEPLQAAKDAHVSANPDGEESYWNSPNENWNYRPCTPGDMAELDPATQAVWADELGARRRLTGEWEWAR